MWGIVYRGSEYQLLSNTVPCGH